MKSIVTIGGGTGQFTLLSGLKKYPVKLTAIVSMADDGGSTGILRDELGVLPPGDIRQCLVALSEADSIMRELWNFRFDQGGLSGHNFGNIFLSALQKITGSFEEAVRLSSRTLKIRGEVIPVTTQNVKLLADKKNPIVGEHAINVSALADKSSLRLEPQADANPRAVEAIKNADCVVIGPGNFYCSIAPNLLVSGIPEAINKSEAVVVYNCNLMTKAGHTDGFSVENFIHEINRLIGAERVNCVIFNSKIPDSNLLQKYALEGEFPVKIGGGDLAKLKIKTLGADLINRDMPALKSGDPLKRTLIRHDPDILARLIIKHCLPDESR